MSYLEALSAVAAIPTTSVSPDQDVNIPEHTPAQNTGMSFSDMLSNGIAGTEAKVQKANDLTMEFIKDPNSMPVHEVLIALESARLSVDLAMQVRTRLVEGYREVMNMQL